MCPCLGCVLRAWDGGFDWVSEQDRGHRYVGASHKTDGLDHLPLSLSAAPPPCLHSSPSFIFPTKVNPLPSAYMRLSMLSCLESALSLPLSFSLLLLEGSCLHQLKGLRVLPTTAVLRALESPLP